MVVVAALALALALAPVLALALALALAPVLALEAVDKPAAIQSRWDSITSTSDESINEQSISSFDNGMGTIVLVRFTHE